MLYWFWLTEDGAMANESQNRGIETPLHVRILNRMKAPRRAVNFLLLPRLQLGMAGAILAITVTFLGCLAVMFYVGLAPLAQSILLSTDANDELSAIVLEQLWHAAAQCALLIFIYAGFVVTLTLVITHRMIGPTIAFKRHVDCLLNDDYSSRVRLRTSDAFQDLASRLNELAIKLGNRK